MISQLLTNHRTTAPRRQEAPVPFDFGVAALKSFVARSLMLFLVICLANSAVLSAADTVDPTSENVNNSNPRDDAKGATEIPQATGATAFRPTTKPFGLQWRPPAPQERSTAPASFQARNARPLRPAASATPTEDAQTADADPFRNPFRDNLFDATTRRPSTAEVRRPQQPPAGAAIAVSSPGGSVPITIRRAASSGPSAEGIQLVSALGRDTVHATRATEQLAQSSISAGPSAPRPDPGPSPSLELRPATALISGSAAQMVRRAGYQRPADRLDGHREPSTAPPRDRANLDELAQTSPSTLPQGLDLGDDLGDQSSDVDDFLESPFESDPIMDDLQAPPSMDDGRMSIPGDGGLEEILEADENELDAESTDVFDEPDVDPSMDGELPDDEITIPPFDELDDFDAGDEFSDEPDKDRPQDRATPEDAASTAADEPSADDEEPECDRIYNERDCCAEEEDCRLVDELRTKPLSSISLDISPSFAPTESDKDEVAKIRREKLARSPSRNWTNNKGETVATGRLDDLRNNRVLVRGDDGNVSEIRYRDLSRDDLCFVNAWWDLPSECPLGDEPMTIRNWTLTTFTWKAPVSCHKPLYFEHVELERFGHSAGPILQPVASGAHFFAHVILLPYSVGLHAPNECLYTLGHYRPGSCAPRLLPAFPLSGRAAAYQTTAVLGLWGILH